MTKRVSARKQKDRSKVKIILILSFFVLAWTGLWGRALYIQVIEGERLAEMADRQYYSREKITGKRGEIFDRNGVVLAQSVRSKSVYANPFLIENRDEVAKFLSAALEKDYRKVS
ncbi:MAG: penicillin-binding protein, partial [Desulfovibrionales bacterium]|nr:penicillin-binding protein [Desulfovibrionales bacterium]